KLPSGRCTADTPETLPTVTSSTITGEFCGRVATSGTSMLMLYEPAPWPAVPGMFNEFNPPIWQPASSSAPEPIASVRRQVRLSLRPSDFRVIRPLLAGPVRQAASAGHPRLGNRRVPLQVAPAAGRQVVPAPLPDRA